MTIQELINKYKEKVNHHLQYNAGKKLGEVSIRSCNEIVQDLERLKQKIRELIQFLPSEIKTYILDDSTFIEYKITDSDFRNILGE